MGSSHGKCRRPNGVIKGGDGCSSLYALCGNKPSSVIYNKSLENCSLKLYRVENGDDQDDVVVMLDCGGRVYANGKKVYPFDNNSSDSSEELNVSQVIGQLSKLSNGRLPDIFAKGGSIEKHISPGDYSGALDSLLSIVAETFNQLLLDGLKMQEGMRTLEEEKTNLSLKVLELKREQLHSQKLELEKKKLELRVEELETSLSLQSGMFIRPSYTSATLSRACSIGIGDGPSRYGGARLGQRKPNRTGSLRRDGRLPQDIEETKNGHQPRHRVVARLRELEVEREKITHQSSLLQFQLDALTAQHEITQSKKRGQGAMNINGKLPESPTRGKKHGANENAPRSSISESIEKLSTSSNGSSINGSPLNVPSITDDPFDNESSTDDYTMSESSETGGTKSGSTLNGSVINGLSEVDIPIHGSCSFTNGVDITGSSQYRQTNELAKSFNRCESSEEDQTDGPIGRGIHRSRLGSGNHEKVYATNGNTDCFRENRFKTREATREEKYDTLKKRYEDLKKKRAQRLHQGDVFVSSDDMASSPALQQRTTQINMCGNDVDFKSRTPLVDC